MQKLLLIISFLWLAQVQLFACSCAPPPSFLEHIQSDYFEENHGIVWVGKYVHDEPISQSLHATAYQIEDIWCGSITYDFDIQPDPFMGDPEWLENYLPTDSLIWVIGGDEAACLEFHGTSDMLFATPVNIWGPGYGYSTSLCQIDFLPISSDGSSVSGFIENTDDFITRDLGELKQEILGICTDDEPTAIDDDVVHFSVYPNPFFEDLIISTDSETLQESTLSIYSTAGSLMLTTDSNDGHLSLGELDSGIYFLEINHGGRKSVERIVKN